MMAGYPPDPRGIGTKQGMGGFPRKGNGGIGKETCDRCGHIFKKGEEKVINTKYNFMGAPEKETLCKKCARWV